MLLRYLETENFLAHEKESIAFPDTGIFLLSGPSGSGKSSFIIDAMAYALFGVVATRAKRQQDLYTGGKKQSMGVRATFDFSPERRITIARGLDDRGASWAEVYEDGAQTLLAEGSAPVARFVRSELGGMTWQQFYAAFVARQNEIAMLTSLRGAERKNLVQRMLGMRELEKTADIISENMRRLGAEEEQIASGISGDANLRTEEITRLRDQIGSLEDEQKSKKLSLGETQKSLLSIDKDLRPLEEAFRSTEQRQGVISQIATLQERKRALLLMKDRRKGASPEALPQLRQDLQKKQNKQDQLREQYRRISERKQLQQEVSLLGDFDPDKKIEDVQKQIAFLHQQKETAREDVALFEKRGQDLLETGQCDLCRRPFASPDEKNRVEASIAAELQKALQEAELAEQTLADLEKELPLWQQNEERKQKAQQLQERIADLPEGDLDQVEKSGKVLGEEIKSLEQKIMEAEIARSDDFDPKELRSVEERLLELEASIPEAEGDESALQDLRDKKLEAEKQNNVLQGEISSLQRQIDDCRSSLKRHKEAQRANEKEEKKLERVHGLYSVQENLQTYLRGYQKHLAHEIRPALEEIGSEMMRRVSGGQHRAIHLDDNYEIELETSTGQRITSSMLSGGEAVRASICLRLALTRLVSSRTGVPVSFLVLDEPLPAQDPGHIERIMELLNSLRPFYQQQFIISHVGNLTVSEEVDYLLQFGAGEIQLLRS